MKTTAKILLIAICFFALAIPALAQTPSPADPFTSASNRLEKLRTGVPYPDEEIAKFRDELGQSGKTLKNIKTSERELRKLQILGYRVTASQALIRLQMGTSTDPDVDSDIMYEYAEKADVDLEKWKVDDETIERLIAYNHTALAQAKMARYALLFSSDPQLVLQVRLHILKAQRLYSKWNDFEARMRLTQLNALMQTLSLVGRPTSKQKR